ncbi:hypothetical protein GCM10009710_26300 [Aeromicrobium alkaliterrae]|uniref:Polysaccharide pyruvyl transferase domain-containing protein n=1 Tax=Aeromicrobium alkaliterrae TaxID=302168 RepID=A0ABN2K1T1_9ACTN
MPRREPVTFVSATGPEKNLGDAVIRRQVVRWAAAGGGPLVAYVGVSSRDWERSLGLDDRFTVLRSKSSIGRWIWLVSTSPRRSRLFFEPGEVPLGAGNVKRELVFLLLTILLRLRGGEVVRPPRAIRVSSRSPLAVHRLACRLSTIVLWREARSREAAGVGEVVPDIGFAEDVRPGRPAPDRDTLVISMRGDRPAPSASWLAHVKELVATTGLRALVVSQVTDDIDRGSEIAAALEAEQQAWEPGDLVAHEELLRATYDRSALVVSDRLHVLILASLSGAVPIELVDTPAWKVAANFDTIGFARVSFASDGSSATSRALLDQVGRGDELVDRVAAAHATLAHRWPELDVPSPREIGGS